MSLEPFQETFFNDAELLGVALEGMLGDRVKVLYPTPETFTYDKPGRTFELGLELADDPSHPLSRVLVDPIRLRQAVQCRKLGEFSTAVADAFKAANPVLRS